MAAKTQQMSVRLEPRESAMLRQLARALGESKSDVLRALIHEAYQKKLAKLSTRAGFGFAPSGLLPASKPKKKAKNAKRR